MRVTNLTFLPFLLRLAASCSLTGHTLRFYENDIKNKSVERRWAHINTDRDDDEDPKAPSAIPWGRVWKDNTILWCFKNVNEWSATGVDVIRGDIRAAWNLWVAAGIDEQVMTFREGSVEECQGTNILLVKRGDLETSAGKKNGVIAVMNLNEARTALGDRVANFAHEIGHAWGMLHEHQRPNMWQFGKYEGGKAWANFFIFHCENKFGFPEYTKGLTEEQKTDICTSYLKTKKGYTAADGFSTTRLNLEEWLPYPRTNWLEAGGESGEGFDDKSIMLYPSRLGADTDYLGRLQVLYTKNDGTELTANTTPSPDDVAGLSAMYPRTVPADKPCLLTDDCNPQQAAFRASQGSGSCSS